MRMTTFGRIARFAGPGLAVVLVLTAWTTGVAADNARDDARMQRWLKRHPDADTDKDGQLSHQEYRELRRKLKQGKPARIRPDFADVAYGQHRRQVLDFWKAESDSPAPVLVFFHGGGFRAGNKKLLSLQIRALPHGVSAASANYRFVTEEGVTLREVMQDSARVIQFLRAKADEWHIDPARIALTGGSAGGVISLWLAFHDDLADPKSDDPLGRFSTRVTCALPLSAPTSLDPRVILKHVGGRPDVHPSMMPCFDVDSIDQLEQPEKRKMVEEYSPINHASEDDPPVFLFYGRAPTEGLLPEDASYGVSIHNGKFGVMLKERMDELGVECLLQYQGRGAEDGRLGFLLRHFGITEGDSPVDVKPGVP